MSETTGEVTTPELRQEIVAKVGDVLREHFGVFDACDTAVIEACAAMFALLDQREVAALPPPDWTGDGCDGWHAGRHDVELDPTSEIGGPQIKLDGDAIQRETALSLAAALRAAAHAPVWSSETAGA